MPVNVEIKARLPHIETTERLAARLADSGPVLIQQDDTFFGCENGRLKLRCFSEAEGELIYYERASAAGPKQSFYVRTPTNDPSQLRQALTLAYGEVGRVVKERTLYLVGRTRIHLDRVKDLGDFLELEVVLSESEDPGVGTVEAEQLMQALGIDATQLIEDAYVDLLNGAD